VEIRCANTFGIAMPPLDLPDDLFWILWWTLLLSTAVIGALLGVVTGRMLDGRMARRLRMAQVWVMIPVCLVAILFSMVAIIAVGGLTMWPSFLLLGFVVGFAPWTEIHSHE
jgi:hypothetical protein